MINITSIHTRIVLTLGEVRGTFTGNVDSLSKVLQNAGVSHSVNNHTKYEYPKSSELLIEKDGSLLTLSNTSDDYVELQGSSVQLSKILPNVDVQLWR